MAKIEIALVDTNVLLRLFLGDIKGQFESAKAIFSRVERGELVANLSLLVINELVWIMENYYHRDRKDYLDLVLTVLSMKQVKIIDADKKVVVRGLRAMLRYKLDFTDLYLWKVSSGDGIRLISFDKKLLKLVK